MTAEEFFEELKRLIDADPKPPNHTVGCENCDYGDHNYYSKNLMYCFDCLKSSDSTYLHDSLLTTNCIDCDYLIECQLCYECVEAEKCFNCEYLENCSHMVDSAYSYNSRNCRNVFGCVNLRNKSFCIFNRQLTEEEYNRQLHKYKMWSPEKILQIVEDLKKKYPLTQTNESNNENTSYGNYFYNNKNSYLCFTASDNTDSGYIYDSTAMNTSYDITYSTENELCYEVTDSGQCFNCNYIVYSAACLDSSYIINCLDVKNSLGCVGKTHKQYVILNRQYTKEEYERKSREILEDIKRKNLGWANLTYY